MISFRKRRNRGQSFMTLNTTATADISFMLLIFFLVTTSMEVDKAMPRQLPPSNPNNEQRLDVDRQKVMTIHLAKDGALTINDNPVQKDKIRRQVKDFIVKIGPQHIIEVIADRDATYDHYFELQNQLLRAYRELRDAAAKQRFGHPYAQCNEDMRESILQAYPQRIQETTPSSMN